MNNQNNNNEIEVGAEKRTRPASNGVINSQFHPFTKFLHWSIVLLVIAQFLNSDFIPDGRGAVSAGFLSNSHFSFGLLIFPLALIMLIVHYLRPTPEAEYQTSKLQVMALATMEFLLYTLLFLIPIAGLAAASGRGDVVSFSGLFNIPELFAQGSSFAHTLGRMHSGLAGLIAFLVTGHVGMALLHHFVIKDNALNRMLPKFLMRKGV